MNHEAREDHGDDYPMTYAEFQEHVIATESVERREGDYTYAVGQYVGRECAIGRYNHVTGIANLYCI